MSETAPRVQRVVETALYVDDLPRATAFYRDLLGFEVMSDGDRLVAMDAGGATVLLLFLRNATTEGFRWAGGYIPPHNGSGPLHVAFGVTVDAIESWERKLESRGIAIEGRVTWSKGGKSVYFRDPDGHLVELVTPGTWKNY